MAGIRNADRDTERKRAERSGDFDRRANVVRKHRIREAREQEVSGGAQRRGRNDFMSLIGYGGSDDE